MLNKVVTKETKRKIIIDNELVMNTTESKGSNELGMNSALQAEGRRFDPVNSHKKAVKTSLTASLF